VIRTRAKETTTMSFVVGLLLFVVLAGILDAKLPWPRAREQRRW